MTSRARAFDVKYGAVRREVAVHGSGKKPSAGREDRVRRIGEELHDHLTPNAMRAAHPADNGVRGASAR